MCVGSIHEDGIGLHSELVMGHQQYNRQSRVTTHRCAEVDHLAPVRGNREPARPQVDETVLHQSNYSTELEEESLPIISYHHHYHHHYHHPQHNHL